MRGAGLQSGPNLRGQLAIRTRLTELPDQLMGNAHEAEVADQEPRQNVSEPRIAVSIHLVCFVAYIG
jgi:hypothetical protein